MSSPVHLLFINKSLHRLLLQLLIPIHSIIAVIIHKLAPQNWHRYLRTGAEQGVNI